MPALSRASSTRPRLRHRRAALIAAAVLTASFGIQPFTVFGASAAESAPVAATPAAPPAPAPAVAPTPLAEMPEATPGTLVGLPEAAPPATPPTGNVTLGRTSDPTWPIASTGGDVAVRFGTDAAHLVEITMPEGRAILSARTPLDVTGAPRIDGNGVVFADVAPDTDLRFDAGPLGVTQRLVIKSAAAPRELSLFVSDPDGALIGMTDVGGGEYSLGSGEQTRLAVMPAYAYEHTTGAVGSMHDPGSAHQSVTADDGGYVVRSWVDDEWLDDHDFPIELDPDYTVVMAGVATGGRFNSVTLARTLDTRNGTGGSSVAVPANGSYTVTITGRAGIPSTGVAAAFFHVAPIAPTVAGKIAVYPAGATTNISSQVSFIAGHDTSSSAIVKLGTNGAVTVYNRSTVAMHIVLDVMGWYSTTADVDSGGTLKLLTPARILDTRTTATGLSPAETLNLRVNGYGGLPSNAGDWSSVILNVTAVGPTTNSYFTIFPTGATRPGVSSMNFETTSASLITTKTSATGVISIYSPYGNVDVLVEVIGYYTPLDAEGFSPYTALAPSRFVDTRSALGTTRTTAIPSLTAVDFNVLNKGGIPAGGIAAVALNIVTVDPTATAYVNVYNGDFAEPTGVSTLQTRVGEDRQSLVIVQPSANGDVRVRPHGTSTHILIEVAGWFQIPRRSPDLTASLVEAQPGDGFSSGQSVTMRMSVSNPDPASSFRLDTKATVPLGMTTAVGGIRVDGQPCLAPVLCSVDGATVYVTRIPMPIGSSVVIDVPLVVAATRGCSVLTVLADKIKAIAVYADGGQYVRSPAADIPLTVCDTGLGFEPWWSYVKRATGPAGEAAVNVANGNLVLQQTDSTMIPAHGRLSFVPRRTYNSQDRGLVSLPGALASGWTLNVGEAGDTTGLGLSGSGLYLPSVESALSPASVTMVDRDGTRHLFQPRAVSPLNLVPADVPTAEAGARSVLAPQTTLLPSGYTHLCVDQAYTPPPGVHLSLWRYVAVNAQGTDPCAAASAAPAGAVTAGFAAIRPDRVRTEYDVTGRLVSLLDASGNELRYDYAVAPVVPAVPAVDEPLLTISEIRVTTAQRRTMTLTKKAAVGTACGPAATRQVDLVDPAGRLTKYCVLEAGVKSYLLRVVNPDGSALDYRYHAVRLADDSANGSCTGAVTGQLCAATDPRGAATSFAYAAAAGGTVANPWPQVASVTDRRGKATTFDYHHDATPQYVNVDRISRNLDTNALVSTRRLRYSAIDDAGRAGQLDEGTPGSTTDPSITSATRQTVYTWDTGAGGVTCRNTTQVGSDNLLCSRRSKTLGVHSRYSVNGFVASPDELVEYLYNLEGQVVRERRHTNPGVTGDVVGDMTTGYRAQYVESNGTVTCYDDKVAGSGTVTSAAATCRGASTGTGRARNGDGTMFVISDLVETLPSNGNAVASWTEHRTSYTVDNNVTRSPNARATTGACADPAAPAGNSGLTCRVDAAHDGATRAVTSYGYDVWGQRTSETKPEGGETSFEYYGDGTTDLSGTTGAAGWLKAVTDPADNFVVFGHDAAGNVARTWDRNATAANEDTAGARISLSAYPGTDTTFPNGDRSFTEERRESLPGKTSFSGPWRGLIRSRDQLGNITTFTVDDSQNVISTTGPRGQVRSTTDPLDEDAITQNAAYTTTRTYGTGDELLTEATPQPSYVTGAAASQSHYNDFGERDAVKDPKGNPTSFVYDTVGRLVRTYFVRGPSSDTTLRERSAGCSDNSGWLILHPWMPDDHVVCHQGAPYFDGLDRVHYEVSDNGFERFHTFDGLKRPVRTAIVRNLTTDTAITDRRYDRNGNVLRSCPGRQFDETGDCDGANNFGTTSTYDTANRVRTSTVKRKLVGDATATPSTTTFGYDRNGNRTSVQEPVADRPATVTAYDALDRPVCQSVPRSHGTDAQTNHHTWEYDPSGAVTRSTRPGASGCPTAEAPSPAGVATLFTYDAAHRRTDVLDAPSTAGDGADGGSDVHSRVVYDAAGSVVASYDPRAFAPGAPALASTPYVARTRYDVAGRPDAQWVPRSGGDGAEDPSLNGPGSTPVTTQRDDCPTGAAGYPSTTHVCASELLYDAAGNVATMWLPTSAGERTKAASGRGARYVQYGYTMDNKAMSTDVAAPTGGGTARAVTRTYYDASGAVTATMGSRFDPADATAKHLDISTVKYYGDGSVYTRSSPAGVPASSTSTVESLTHVEMFNHDDNGNVIWEKSPSGVVTTRRYYSDDLLENVVTPSDRFRVVTVNGIAQTEYDPAGDVTSYVYDGVGSVIRTYSPAANAAGGTFADATQSSRTPTMTDYSDDGLVLTTRTPVAPNGEATDGTATFRQETFAYDAGGRRTSASVETVARNAAGFTSDKFTGAGNATTQSFAYYDNDRQKTETGRTGAVVTNKYDAAGNPLSRTSTDGAAGDVTGMTYYYDGLVRSAVSGGRRTTYAYDGAGRPAAWALTTTAGAAQPGTTVATRDDAGQVTSLTAPAAVGGLTGTLATGEFAWSYDIAGRPAVETLPNGGRTAFTWANDGTLTQRETTRSATDSALLARWSYAYDGGRRVTGQTFEGADGATTVPATASAYTYTNAGRLKSFKDGSGATQWANWDHSGNRTCFGAGCAHDTTAASGTTRTAFTYRADNSIRGETPTGTATETLYADPYAFGGLKSDRCSTYDYDGFDRTKSVTARANTTGCGTVPTTTYTYDTMDRQTSSSVGGALTELGYLGTTATADRMTKGAAAVDYALSPSGIPLAVKDTTKTQYLGGDGSGSVATVVATTVNGAADAACQVRYDPFGGRLGAAGNGAVSTCTATVTPNDRFYRAGRADESTGAYQLGSRTYDPSKGSFLTPDSYRGGPAEADDALKTDPLTSNRYSYVNGDPVNFVDPSGHMREPTQDTGAPCDTRCQLDAIYAANRQRMSNDRDLLARQDRKSLIPGHNDRLKALNKLLADPGRQFLHYDGQPEPGGDRNMFGDGRVVEVFGDLSTARHIGIVVPGLNSTADNASGGDARRLHAGEEGVATISWLGYDAPGNSNVLSDNAAENGAKELVKFVDQVRTYNGEASLRVFAHSYGSLVTGLAIRKHGMQIDDAAFLGSPGIRADSVAELNSPGTQFWGAHAHSDHVVASTNRFGPDPAAAAFGTSAIPTEKISNHSDYYDQGSDTLSFLRAILKGIAMYDPCRTGGGRGDGTR